MAIEDDKVYLWPHGWLMKAIESATNNKVLDQLHQLAPLVSIAISLHRIANALEKVNDDDNKVPHFGPSAGLAQQ